MNKKIVAILSTTILPIDGDYTVRTLEECPDISGIPHFIGHPSTKEIVEGKGAVPAESKLFPGLQPGESALAFAIKQGRSSRVELGKTVDQEVTEQDLSIRIITRIDWKDCCFCGQPTRYDDGVCRHCGGE